MQVTQEQLRRHLLEDVFCRVAPSIIHGVGVLCIKVIPSGENPFRGLVDAEECETDLINEAEINADVLSLAKARHLVNGTRINLDRYTFNDACIWFLNHSENPNLVLTEDGFRTTRRVEIGEELTWDYRTMNQ